MKNLINIDVSEIASIEVKETLFSYKYIIVFKSGRKITCNCYDREEVALAYGRYKREHKQ